MRRRRAATRGLWAGETVVFNVSRSVIDAARRRFPRVRVVYVTAPPDVLARRIAARGRDGDAVARLARAEALDRRADADLVIDNVGDSAVHAGALAVFLLAPLA